MESRRPSCAYCDVSVPLASRKFEKREGLFYHADGGDRSCSNRALAVENAKPFLLSLTNFLTKEGICLKGGVKNCLDRIAKATRYSTLREIARDLMEKIRENAEHFRSIARDALDALKRWLDNLGELLRLPKGNSVLAT